MAKTIDFPNEIRDFGKALDQFSGRHYDYEVFSDFIDYVVACLLIDGDKELAERLKSKYGNEYPKFFELYRELLLCMQKNLGTGDDYDWYDVLGTAYEVVASRSKASSFGQFFTPKPVCDFMAAITGPLKDAPDEKRTGLRVSDPSCGSARTLLAFNKVAPGNRLYADDLDLICTKMAAINLALHGCKGQACNVNSLMPDDWRFGYEINPMQYMFMGIPHIRPIQKEQSDTWAHWQITKLEFAAKGSTAAAAPKKETPKPTLKAEPKPKTMTPEPAPMIDIDPGTQLTLF